MKAFKKSQGISSKKTKNKKQKNPKNSRPLIVGRGVLPPTPVL